MKKKAVLVAYVALLATPVAVMAQYPQLTEEAKAKYDKMITEARRRSDEAWAKALPIIEKEAEQGRPYIPWASRPDDLPQAKIPAFPGAEGGGMYSFGGRGGKVITVTNLNCVQCIRYHSFGIADYRACSLCDDCGPDCTGRRSLHCRRIFLGGHA